MMTILMLGVITVLILLYLHVTRHFNYWKNRNVPYIKPIPFFGNVFAIALQKEPLTSFLYRLYKSTNLPLIGFFVFDQPFVLIRDPQLIKNVLATHFDYFGDRTLLRNKKDKYFSEALFMINQPKWKVIRTAVTPTFSSAKLRNMVPLVLQSAEDMVDYINNVCLGKNSTNCRDVAMNFALDVISSCAFGLRANLNQNPKFVALARRLLGADLSRVIQVASHFIAPFLVNIFQFKFIDVISGRYMEQIVLNTIKERKETNLNRSDLIDLLIKIQIKDPVVFESLRKYPVTSYLDRRCTEKFLIPNSDVVIDEGIPVYIPIMALHYDESYFPNPHKFDPERFSPENEAAIIPFTYMPFGEGYRNCIGKKFGMLTVSIGLIKILTNFEVSMGDDTPSSIIFENKWFLLTPKNYTLSIKFNKIQSD